MTSFKIGDSVKINEELELIPSLHKFVGSIGTVFHAQTAMSPYSGEISQVIGVRFANHARHLTENGGWFVPAEAIR